MLPNSDSGKFDAQLSELQLESVYRLASLDIRQPLLNGNEEDQSLKAKRHFCSTLLSDVDALLQRLGDLNLNYTSVAQKTNSLHEACQHLMTEQTKISDSVAELEKALSYFVNVDSVESELTSRRFVLSASRLGPLLDKLDQSITFFQVHTEFKEAQRYLAKATSLLNQALTMLQQGVGQLIERTINEVLDLQDAVTPDNSFILLYGRFRSQGPKVRAFMALIESRVAVCDDYLRAIDACHQVYIQRRQELVLPMVENGLADLITRHDDDLDHCGLLRAGGQFMLHTCDDEARLFAQFFASSASSPDTPLASAGNQLSQMLIQFCRLFYDAFRPRIIHVNHIELLTELCDILRYELVSYREQEDGNEEFRERSSSTNRQSDLSAFDELRGMLLSDVQHRLVFRAQVYIEEEIAGYQPGPGDLRYPEKLEMMQEIAQKADDNHDDVLHTSEQELSTNDDKPPDSNGLTSVDLFVQPGPNMSLSPADLHGMWYPTLRRTLVCLSKLSRCLDADSFRGLAQHGITRCIESLTLASRLIISRKSKRDGQLFLIKHLLILREQMLPFNVEFSVKETSLDFSTYKEAAVGLWQHKGSGLLQLSRTNTLLRLLLETPNVIDVEVDSREQLDGLLKQTCQSFIAEASRELGGDLQGFLAKAASALTSPGARLADQAFASPQEVANLVGQSYRLLTISLATPATKKSTTSTNRPSLLRSLHVYLANRDTEAILLDRIANEVLGWWQQLSDLLVDAYNSEDRLIVGCPTLSQIRLLFQRA